MTIDQFNQETQINPTLNDNAKYRRMALSLLAENDQLKASIASLNQNRLQARLPVEFLHERQFSNDLHWPAPQNEIYSHLGHTPLPHYLVVLQHPIPTRPAHEQATHLTTPAPAISTSRNKPPLLQAACAGILATIAVFAFFLSIVASFMEMQSLLLSLLFATLASTFLVFVVLRPPHDN